MILFILCFPSLSAALSATFLLIHNTGLFKGHYYNQNDNEKRALKQDAPGFWFVKLPASGLAARTLMPLFMLLP